MVRDEENNFLYALDTPKKRKLNLKKIIIMIAIFLIIVLLILITKNCLDVIHARELQKQQEEQIALQQQKEAERQAQLERIRQEKIPKLTEVRKTKYGSYLSFGNKKSFFNF